VRLDWAKDSLEALIRSVREPSEPVTGEESAEGEAETGRGGRMRGRGKPEPEIPAALAAMIDERKTERAAAEAATAAPVALPAKSWRDVRARAGTIGAHAELSNDGSQVRILVDIPPAA